MELIGFIAAGVVGWLGIGYTVSAYLFAYCQREFPSIAESERTGDKRMATVFAVFGPLGALPSVIATILWAMMNDRKIYHGFDFGWIWA